MYSSRMFIIESTVAKAYVVWKTVVLSKELGFHNIILEDDALKIVHALCNEAQLWSRYGNLIDDSKLILDGLKS